MMASPVVLSWSLLTCFLFWRNHSLLLPYKEDIPYLHSKTCVKWVQVLAGIEAGPGAKADFYAVLQFPCLGGERSSRVFAAGGDGDGRPNQGAAYIGPCMFYGSEDLN